MAEWISVKDKLPDRNMTCLCFDSEYGVIDIASFYLNISKDLKIEDWEWLYDEEGVDHNYPGFICYEYLSDGFSGGYCECEPTHWMPYPNPEKILNFKTHWEPPKIEFILDDNKS